MDCFSISHNSEWQAIKTRLNAHVFGLCPSITWQLCNHVLVTKKERMAAPLLYPWVSGVLDIPPKREFLVTEQMDHHPTAPQHFTGCIQLCSSTKWSPVQDLATEIQGLLHQFPRLSMTSSAHPLPESFATIFWSQRKREWPHLPVRKNLKVEIRVWSGWNAVIANHCHCKV